MEVKTKKSNVLIYTILAAVLGGVYIGYLLTLITVRPVRYILLITILTAILAIALKVKWKILRTTIIILMMLITLCFIDILPSVSISAELENCTNKDLNVFVINLSTTEAQHFSITEGKSMPVRLCKGESYENLKNSVFLILATDSLGKIYLQEKLKLADINEKCIIKIYDEIDVFR